MTEKKRDTPWMEGNSNASKGMDSRLHINCRSRDKAGWVKQASRERLSLTDWIIKTLNAVVEK